VGVRFGVTPAPTPIPPRKPGTPARGAEDLDALLPAAAPPAVPPPAGFAERAAAIGLEFDDGEVERLGVYLALLLAANERMNLTAVTDPATAWTRHIADSLSLLPMLADLPEGSRVIDVGSGGGLPGVPLAVCLPGLRFTLLEATGKKAAFLERAARLLGLSNVEVRHDRAERAGQDRGAKGTGAGAMREAFDGVVARAVGRLASLAEITVPFAKIGGRVLLMKGEKAAEEVAEAEGALRLLNAMYVQTVEMPTGRVVVLEKNSATPKIYPRGDGEPTSKPLGVKTAGKGTRKGGG
jgi:16S rRNA (guanine527-N7)-methyltransferase